METGREMMTDRGMRRRAKGERGETEGRRGEGQMKAVTESWFPIWAECGHAHMEKRGSLVIELGIVIELLLNRC